MARAVFAAVLALVLGPIQAGTLNAQDIARLKSGVVKITSEEQGKTKVGTGFIIRLTDEQAYILTAAHVVGLDPQPEVEFFTNQNARVRATVIHREGDEPTSLALLMIEGKENLASHLNALSINDTIRVSGGEDIIVIGFPVGAGPWTVLKGSVASRKGRNVVVDVNIDEGSSGGPLIRDGLVVGLVAESTRYGFAVPAESLIEYATKQVPRLNEIFSLMVLIPAGEFWMGSLDSQGANDEHPRHRVHLDAFYMDKFEVTVARYAEFLRVTGRQAPRYWEEVSKGKHGNLPVVGIDWHDAEAYCRWARKRLPTEAEWEKAARGTDGQAYPWGNEAPTPSLANFGKDISDRVKVYEERLVPVESHDAGKSPYGLYHMAGNVWEWVADWYEEHYYQQNASRNPTGPPKGRDKVIRGGSWNDLPDFVRSAYRYRFTPSNRNDYIGFRCAGDASP